MATYIENDTTDIRPVNFSLSLEAASEMVAKSDDDSGPALVPAKKSKPGLLKKVGTKSPTIENIKAIKDSELKAFTKNIMLILVQAFAGHIESLSLEQLSQINSYEIGNKFLEEVQKLLKKNIENNKDLIAKNAKGSSGGPFFWGMIAAIVVVAVIAVVAPFLAPAAGAAAGAAATGGWAITGAIASKIIFAAMASFMLYQVLLQAKPDEVPHGKEAKTAKQEEVNQYMLMQSFLANITDVNNNEQGRTMKQTERSADEMQRVAEHIKQEIQSWGSTTRIEIR